MKQLYNQQHSIMKKHLLLDLELEELSRLAELNDTVQEELEDMSDSPAETPDVLVDEPPRSVENLPTDTQILQQTIMDHPAIEQVKDFTFRSSDTNSWMRYWHKPT